MNIFKSQGVFLVCGYLISLMYLFKLDKTKFWQNSLFYNILIIIGLVWGSLTYSIIFENFNGNYFQFNSLLLSISSVFFIYISSLIFNQRKIITIINLLTVPFALMASVGKIGCYVAGCCKGTIPLICINIPLQLFEALILFLIFLLLRVYSQDKYIIFMILYSISRLIFEFYREDTIKYFFGLKRTVFTILFTFVNFGNYN